jgi:hypothetical protein
MMVNPIYRRNDHENKEVGDASYKDVTTTSAPAEYGYEILFVPDVPNR